MLKKGLALCITDLYRLKYQRTEIPGGLKHISEELGRESHPVLEHKLSKKLISVKETILVKFLRTKWFKRAFLDISHQVEHFEQHGDNRDYFVTWLGRKWLAL